ncbi:STAS domain-containing protein [Caviibacterium pharyngocola]|uniref:NTP-binding protein n=1 Tax=Caviibacterium pharyngocola TaxID=28159 RepID=A0A2M8RUG7_9PAST|nr:lipid asymmetry maintenance protein MlaB [Caviibacterium pharyngocola]PJG82552.1 NTP-binding protein [Caviibacterium pharyngocola]
MQNRKSLDWALVQNDDKITLRLSGELSRDTLLPLWRQRSSFLSAEKIENRDVIWDLAEISRIDSAGFALLCDFIHYCQTLNVRSQRMKDVPVQLETLADLFGLTDWVKSFYL